MSARAVEAERDVRFVDEQERELFAEFQLGDEVLQFCKSHPVGIYLKHRIKQVLAQAEVDALNVDPDSFGGWFRARRKLRQIRAQAQAARLINGWLADAILEGRRAEVELEQYRS